MRTFFTYSFYLCGVLFIVYELMRVGGLNLMTIVKELQEKATAEKKKNEETQSSGVGELESTDQFAFMGFGCLMISWILAYCVWGLVGLFTSQWKLFLLLFVVGTISGLLQKIYQAIIKSEEFNTGITRVTSLITAALLTFIILNRFHLNLI